MDGVYLTKQPPTLLTTAHTSCVILIDGGDLSRGGLDERLGAVTISIPLAGM